jgi:hypothetical protein
MTRRSKLYTALWGLARNPFPDHAIASAGDSGQPFCENLHPGLGSKMARAFVGFNGTAPDAAFLWSLGDGEEARGYGKTRYLLWFANRVNADLGRTVSKLAGQSGKRESLIAAYAAFNTVDGVSLSNLLFDTVRDLVGVRQGVLTTLRTVAFERGCTPSQLYESAQRLLDQSGERWSAPMLYKLCFAAPSEWAEFLDNRYEFSQWHKVRLGPQLLRSAVAFLRQVGVPHVIILVDQVEDFASSMTPLYKLRRDFPRLGYLCSVDPLLRGRLTFVLTMHPRAARSLSRYWPGNELGPIGVDASLENVVRLGAMSRPRFTELVQAYLDSARIEGRSRSVRPLTEGAIDFVFELERGRPGYCLQRLSFLLDAAVNEGVQRIERRYAEQFFVGQRPDQEG